MSYIPRKLEPILKSKLFGGKVLIIYGARQVGKTTLIQKLLQDFSPQESIYLNADDYDIKSGFEEAKNFTELKTIVGSKKFIVIDEAQRIKDIGLKLKILYDNLGKEVQLIATGSSSFELANSVNEPLTGRSLSFVLYPFSLQELSSNHIEFQRNAEHFLTYGSYPGLYSLPAQEAQLQLQEIAEQYLFKDLLSFSGLRKPDYLIKLLKLLAYQVGQPVSYSELASSLGLDQVTVAKYIDVLQQSFVIHRLGSYSTNLRNEIKKNQKIYFYDLGLRNSLINDFNELELRPDLGHLWENLLFIERLKHNAYQAIQPSYYFWRNYDQQEIDLVEDWGRAKNLQCFEFKYRAKKKFKFPRTFVEAYANSDFHIVDRANIEKIFD